MMEDLSGLKAGDKVVLYDGGWTYPEGRVVTIDRCTKQHLIVRPTTFRKSNGFRVASDRWDRVHICLCTPERLAKIATARDKHFVCNFQYASLTAEQVHRVAKLLRSFKAQHVEDIHGEETAK